MMRARWAAGFAAAIGFSILAGAPCVWAQDDAAQAQPASAPVPPAAPPPPPLAGSVVAIVNDEIVSTYDLGQRTRLLIVTSGVQPTSANIDQIQGEALRSLIDEHLEMQEIRHEEKQQKFQIEATDDDVNDDLNRLAAGNHMSSDQLLAALASEGVGPETVREQIRANISWQRWISGRYGGNRLKVARAQVSAVLRQIEMEATKPQYQVSEIFLDAARAGGMNQAMDGAQQLISQMQQGAPFAAVARQFSSASTAANGGDAGWLSPSQLPEELRDPVAQLQPGQLSNPIPAKDGVYIVQLRDKRQGGGADMVSLMQAAIALPASASEDQVGAARRKLLALKSKLGGCDNFQAVAGRVDGVVADDLGEASAEDLKPAFRDALASMQIGDVSDPIRTDVGLHLLALCGRRPAGVTIPTRQEIEARLQDEQLALIGRRYLRDLRNSAMIETR